jgi:hypothetical protein
MAFLAASAQDAVPTKSMTLPDGTKIQVLQEYASSYMVTKEGEHKPFFIEKKAISSDASTSQEVLESTVTQGNWKITTIDPSANKNQFGKPSVVAFNGGTQVAYFSQKGLSLATSRGGKWSIELIEPTTTPAWEGGGRPIDKIAFALDKNGSPHIAYSQHTKLKYATRSDKGWNIQNLHDEGWVIESLHIKLNEEKPEISYTTHQKDIKSTFTGAEWLLTEKSLPAESNKENENRMNRGPFLKATNGILSYAPSGEEEKNPIFSIRMASTLQFNNGQKITPIESTEPGTESLMIAKEGPMVIYVGWTGMLDDPKNSQGLKCAAVIAK